MIRRPPRSTLDRSSAASDVYKRQGQRDVQHLRGLPRVFEEQFEEIAHAVEQQAIAGPVSYTHLRAHETVLDLVCRLLLEQKKTDQKIPLCPTSTSTASTTTNESTNIVNDT